MSDPAEAELHKSAFRWLGRGVETLDEGEARVLKKARHRKVVSRDLNDEIADSSTFGERLADRVAAFGGSWTFILLFCAFLVVWTGANVWLLTQPFDPYPFIFLNLMLSMVAALQAPIIMMSQNRQTDRDRQDAALDYEVNLKAEIEIMALHEKVDSLRIDRLVEALARQEAQIAELRSLVMARPSQT